MIKLVRLVSACVLVISLALPAVAQAQAPLPCTPGTLPGGDPLNPLDDQQILVCIPPAWNGQLVVYAHGYVPPQAPLALPLNELTLPTPITLPDGRTVQTVPEVLMALGFAFVTSSYSKNGYAIEQAGNDLNALVDYFNHVAPHPADKVLMSGASEGGIITTMLVERHPDRYHGGLALCGPVGGMPYQIKYLGDFAVVFDYFFPDVFPFGLADPPVPPISLAEWEGLYVPAIGAAVASNPAAAQQLFKVTRAALDPNDPASAVGVSVGLLFYKALGTPDLLSTASGMPYGNRFTWYHGSTNDAALNRGVERVTASWLARRYTGLFYQTTGRLQRPLVALHNTHDPADPFQHELIYLGLVTARGYLRNLTILPVPRFGHCNFTTDELLGAFALLVQRVGGQLPPILQEPLAALPAPLK